MAHPESAGPRLTAPLQRLDEPGMLCPPGVAENLAREVAVLLGRPNKLGFPGAQPVSFLQKHLQELMRQDYYVCEKSDGIRYLLYSSHDEQMRESYYLIDRKNNYWWIEPGKLHLPQAGDDIQDSFHDYTLVDGELVMDDLGGGYKEPRFLIFDCLVLDKKDLMSRTLDKRLAYCQEHIMKPYKSYCKAFPPRAANHGFKVEMKTMQFSYHIETMFREILPSLKHGNDGLVFTCRTTEYHHGTDPHILKWKPVEENTVDFRLSLNFPMVEPDEVDIAEGITEPYVDYDSVPDAELLVYHGDNARDGPYKVFGKLYISDEEWETLKSLGDPLNDRIVECGIDSQKRWRLHRFRDDKSEANYYKTVDNVMESIENAVSKDELIAAQKAIREHFKIRNSQPTQQK